MVLWVDPDDHDVLTKHTHTPAPPRCFAELGRHLRWDQVETMVCGDPKVDLDLLKSVCTYEGYSAEDEPVQLFWSVMEELSDADRAQVIQFTWSRSRLPLSPAGFTDRFKIKRMSGGDGAFPLAHTCFFQVFILSSLSSLLLRLLL